MAHIQPSDGKLVRERPQLRHRGWCDGLRCFGRLPRDPSDRRPSHGTRCGQRQAARGLIRQAGTWPAEVPQCVVRCDLLKLCWPVPIGIAAQRTGGAGGDHAHPVDQRPTASGVPGGDGVGDQPGAVLVQLGCPAIAIAVAASASPSPSRVSSPTAAGWLMPTPRGRAVADKLANDRSVNYVAPTASALVEL
jgi:hypothetical protein